MRSDNRLLIIAGALDGSSGLILSIIMCRAMNRSFTNMLFGAFGQVQKKAGAVERAAHRTQRRAEEAAAILDAARSVIIVPGYGMAVAQAQHKVRELYDALDASRGVDVRFAIHPVAGRMPGHMNVLLAEADIPYDKLIEMETSMANSRRRTWRWSSAPTTSPIPPRATMNQPHLWHADSGRR